MMMTTDAREGAERDEGATAAAPSLSGEARSVAFEEVRRTARHHAPDLYLSALLAPSRVRADLIAIAAFFGDVDRIVATVSEPSLAHIRLQWWRDSIASGLADGTSSGSPVADAVVAAAHRHRLSIDLFDAALEARTLDLYADPLPDEAALTRYCRDTAGSAFALAALVLTGDVDTKGTSSPGQRGALTLVDAAADAYGRSRLLCRTAVVFARGRSPFPGPFPSSDTEVQAMMDGRRAETTEAIAIARRIWRNGSASDRAACLPLAVAPAYVSASRSKGYDPRRTVVDITDLDRAWRLWRGKWVRP